MNQIFDRELLGKNRKYLLDIFSRHDFLYQEIANRIIDNLQILTNNFTSHKIESLLEISANNGYLTKQILFKTKIKQNVKTEIFYNKNVDLIADDEFLPFKKESFDLIVSNLNLQHINFVPQFLMQIKQILKPNGIFIASFFGEENLFDLKKAVFEAEELIYKSVSPRMIPTIDIKSAARLLQKAGFINPIASLEKISVEYENPIKLLVDLKNMGQGNILNLRSRKFATRGFIDEILKKYPRIAGQNAISAQFEIIIISAW